MIKFPDGEDRLLLRCSEGYGPGPAFFGRPKPGGGPSQTFERGPENLRVLFSKFEGRSKARAWNL